MQPPWYVSFLFNNHIQSIHPRINSEQFSMSVKILTFRKCKIVWQNSSCKSFLWNPICTCYVIYFMAVCYCCRISLTFKVLCIYSHTIQIHTYKLISICFNRFLSTKIYSFLYLWWFVGLDMFRKVFLLSKPTYAY